MNGRRVVKRSELAKAGISPGQYFDVLPEELLLLIFNGLNFFALTSLRQSCFFFLMYENLFLFCRHTLKSDYSLFAGSTKNQHFFIFGDMVWSKQQDSAALKMVGNTLIQKAGGVKEFFCNDQFSVFLCHNGTLWKLERNIMVSFRSSLHRSREYHQQWFCSPLNSEPFLKAGGIKKIFTQLLYDGLAVLCQDGTLFVSDYSSYCTDLGLIRIKYRSDQFKFIPVASMLIKKAGGIKDACMGENHSIAVGMNDELFVCGMNNTGQLGLGHRNLQESFAWLHNDAFKTAGKIKQLVATKNKSVLLFSNGTMFVAGVSECNQFIPFHDSRIESSGGICEIILNAKKNEIKGWLCKNGDVHCIQDSGFIDRIVTVFPTKQNGFVREAVDIKKVIILGSAIFILLHQGSVIVGNVDYGLKNIKDILVDASGEHVIAVGEDGKLFIYAPAISAFNYWNCSASNFFAENKSDDFGSFVPSAVLSQSIGKVESFLNSTITCSPEPNTVTVSENSSTVNLNPMHVFGERLIVFLQSEIHHISERMKRKKYDINFDWFQTKNKTSEYGNFLDPLGKLIKLQLVLSWLSKQNGISVDELKMVMQLIHSVCALKRKSMDPRKAKSQMRFEINFGQFQLPDSPMLSAEELKTFRLEDDIPFLMDKMKTKIEVGEGNRNNCVMQ